MPQPSDDSPTWAFPATRVATLSAGFMVLILAAFWATYGLGQSSTSSLSTLMAFLFSAILALALGTLTFLFISDKNRLPDVLRINVRRVLPAILMAGLTPVAVFDWMPWLAGTFIGIGLFPVGFGTAFGDALIVMIMSLIAAILLAALWYVPSCLILSNTKTKPGHVALFALLWSGAYAAILLATGNLSLHP